MKKAIEPCKNNFLATLITLLFLAVVLISSPSSRNMNTILTMFKQGFAPAVLAWGVLFDLTVGNWDFSVGAEVLLASIIGGHIAQDFGLGVPGMIICCILVGTLCGLIVSFVYRILNIPTIIASIGMLLIYESISGLIYNGEGVVLNNSFIVMSNPFMSIGTFIVSFALAYILFYRRRFGFNTRSVGFNQKIAEENGINVLHTKMGAMIVVGLFAGIYAAINIGSAGVARVASNMTSMAVCFDAMMCVFVGMAICGKGNMIFSVYCGAVIMQIVKLLLMILNIPATANKIIIAAIVTILMVCSSRADLLQDIAAKFRRKNSKEAKT